MYAYIEGKLVEATPVDAIIDVGGVGYHLQIAVRDYSALPQVGEQVRLYTAFVVRELSQTLYGFLAREARDLFEELIGISGIGPRTGVAIIGHLSLEELRESVESHDAARFAKVPGIGKKTAERLLIELQGRLKIRATPQPKGHLGDALQALIQLGYTQSAAEKALKKAADGVGAESDLSTLLTAALKYQ